MASDEPSGAVAWLFDAQESGIVSIVIRHEHDGSGDYRPIDVTLMNAHGTQHALSGGDGAAWGSGDGVAYAGVGDFAFRTPGLLPGTSEGPGEWNLGAPLSAGRNVLVVAWARQPGPISVELAHPPNVTLQEVRGVVRSVSELPDGQGGAHVGAPAVARVHVANRLAHTSAGGHLFASVNYTVSDAFGVGGLRVRADEHEKNAEWTNLTGWTTGLRMRYGQMVLSAAEDVGLEWEYAGDGRRTQLFAVVAEFPTPILPPGIWAQ